MDSQDFGDEGYLSPLDGIGESQESNRFVYSNRKDVSDRRRKIVSWDDLRRLKDGEDIENNKKYFVTDIIGSESAKITDNLWRITPEVQILALGIQHPSSLPVPLHHELSRIFQTDLSLSYIPLTEFLRDTLDMLTGKRSKTFAYGSKKVFVKNPAVLVHGVCPSTLANFCRPLVATATFLVQLNQIENMFHFHLSMSKSEFNVCVQFVNFIKDYLLVYETIIMVKRNMIMSLLQLRRFIKPFQKQIAVLSAIAESQKILSPSLLLKNLNDFMLKNEEPCVSDLLKSLLCTCASAYLRYIGDWVFRGNLMSSMEFFIIKNNVKPSDDRRLWTHQYSQNEDIPHFLTDLKTLIFSAGKKIILLRKFKSEIMPACFDEDNECKIELFSTHEAVLNLLRVYEEKWREFESQNTYLTNEVQDAVASLCDNKMMCTAEEAEEAQTRNTRNYQKYLDEITETRKTAQGKKKVTMDNLLKEIEEVRLRRVRAAIDEVFEENKRAEIRAKADEDAQLRGMKLLKEYYGDLFYEIIEQVGQDQDKPSKLPELLSSTSDQSRIEMAAGDGFHNFGEVEIAELENKEERKGPHSRRDLDNVLPSSVQGQDALHYTESLSAQAQPKAETSVDDVIFTVEPANQSPPKSTDLKKALSKDEKLFWVDMTMFDKPLVHINQDIQENPEDGSFNDQDEFLTNRLFALSVEIPVAYQQKLLNAYTVHHLVVENYLLEHLKILQDCLLMRNGLFLNSFALSMLEKVDSGALKPNEDLITRLWALNPDLESSLSSFVTLYKSDLANNISIDVIPEETEAPTKKRHEAVTSGYEVLNSLSLSYNVRWPVNLVFTDDILRKYEEVCSLQLRLKRAELLLNKAYTHLKSKVTASSQYSELNSYRSVMLHFVRAVQNYINVNVIHSSWPETVQKLSNVDSIEAIHDLFVHHIKQIVSNCLLGPKAKAVMKLLKDQLNIVDSFSAKLVAWAKNSEVITNVKILKHDFKMLVRLYLVFMEIQKVFAQVIFTVASKGYYPKVAHFMEVFNFNGYYTQTKT